MEDYLDKSDDMKVEIEALELLMDPEDSELCLRYILTHARRRGSRIFEIFSTKEELDHIVASRNRSMEYQGKSVAAREVAKRSERRELRRNDGKGSSVPERRMRTPLPLQSSSSTREEESQWSAQERTATARMEQYVNNSECIQLDIDEVEECSLGPEYADIDVKKILRKATREGRNIFEVFKVKGKGELLVTSQWRWDDCQRQMKSQEDKAWKECREFGVEDERKGCVAFEEAAKRMLKYLEESEDLKVCLSELKEQLETPEEAGFSMMQIAQQARNERGQKLFEIFRQGENEVYIANLARWDTQLKGLAELERRCQDLMQEVQQLSERQEVLNGQ